MFFWSEFSIKQNAKRADSLNQMNEARRGEDGTTTYDGLILELAHRVASETNPELLAGVAMDLAHLAERVSREAVTVVEESEWDIQEDDTQEDTEDE